MPNLQSEAPGLINFYYRFIPHGAAILLPLNSVLKSTKRPSDTLAAFSHSKDALTSAILLVHPTPNAPICVVTDASDVDVGAVLQQYSKGQWCPIFFFSKALRPGIVRSIGHLSLHQTFPLLSDDLTDHKPLIYALSARTDQYSPRDLDFIAQFTSDLRHVQRSQNPVADALSRITTKSLHTGDADPVVDFRFMAAAQADDLDLPRVQSDTSLKLQPIPLALTDGATILCDVSTGAFRPYVPESFRRTIFILFPIQVSGPTESVTLAPTTSKSVTAYLQSPLHPPPPKPQGQDVACIGWHTRPTLFSDRSRLVHWREVVWRTLNRPFTI